jgi:cyclopropane-fatty-acyl-phospholipid synthase
MSIAREHLLPPVEPVDGPWRSLPPAPHRPVHAAIARRLLHRAVNRLPVRVELPDGSVTGAGATTDPLIRIYDDAFFHRVGSQGLIGFGESYMARDWDTDDIEGALRPLVENALNLVPQWMQRLKRFYVQHLPSNEANTVRGAQRNIARHYDLSNDLFALFLDETMTYSSARFEAGDTLADAQVRKIDRLLDVARVGAGTRVLEIGSGWGALAIRAAARGATVTTLTLSREQQQLARQRIAAAGMDDRIDVQLRDYRQAEGTYDAIVSVEMIEAVGAQYWPAFFRMLDRSLAPGGTVGLQAIVLEHDRMLATRDQYTWVHKYIFPGGALPSIRAIDDTVRAHTALRITGQHAFGHDYAETLGRWRARFDAHADDVDAMGFDATFRRMWDFYLAYSQAGFATGYLDVVQLRLTREGA